jgi:two-component system, chemotaxis family, response regulator PixG
VDAELTVMTRFCQDLKRIQLIQGSGKFVVQVLTGSAQSWDIYFYMGRIVWATGKKHRIRRWLRALKQHCPAMLNEEWARKISDRMTEQNSNGYWEVQVLDDAVQSGIMSLAQAKAIVNNYVQEAAFHAIDHNKLQCEWQTQKDLPQQFLWLDVDHVLNQASVFCNQWRGAISDKVKDTSLDLSPNRAPIIQDPAALQQKVSPATHQILTKLLNGQNTFWDVALAMQRPMVQVVHSLLPLIYDSVIGLQEVPDLVFPTQRARIPQSATQPSKAVAAPVSKGLIACIDDSPVIGKELEAILSPLGYEVLSIIDPLQSISILIQKKPKLIFLDLIMPNTNGYELCSFFRKSAAFKDIPIVMLTGHDGVIDRLRAKVAGSTDFLGKPPEAEKVQQVVQRLLGEGFADDNSAQPNADRMSLHTAS